MKKIEEVEVNGERVYLRKSLLGWGVVHPYQKIYNNGKINWKNLISGGSWLKLGITILMVVIILLCLYDWANAIRVANQCLANNKLININLP